MRIVLKGGIWRNTEDEILKAAVMKYGKNQWSRISSLLVRKSAKQCKARWYEWLDPSIKKTEWTREEDEKLLHLAKLMPMQWRTIAPIVGRTPSQCLERYTKLLDAGLQRDDDYDPAHDPRRLHPGEIDPNPEGKPARPDAVDMDEDEKEMLSEARARLANTRGKKAKRKAREKQLEEARRLAALQKTRELKAAGIETRRFNRKDRGGIDYNAEIPFEKKAPAGFFDTSGEDAAFAAAAAQKEFKPVTLAELEGQRRRDVEETLMKRDAKKQKILERHDAPAVVQHTNAMNDVDGTRRRSKLMLPAPQMSERELEDLAKMGTSAMLVDDGSDAGNAATRGLLGNYAATPGPALGSLRTPRVQAGGAAGGDYIQQEAENLRMLQQGQTPLLGGEAPRSLGDFTGATPARKTVAATPNPLATPLRTPGGAGAAAGGVGATPARGGGAVGGGAVGGRFGATPLRDELGINEEDILVADSKREERARQALLKRELREGLSGLPAPRNEYQIMVPELPEEEGAEEAMEEDAADAVRRREAEAAAAAALELKKRSQALQRGLPRPAAAPQPAQQGGAGALAAAEALIAAELAAIVAHEAAKYPPAAADGKGRKDKGKQRQGYVPPLPEVALEEMEEAAALIRAEGERVRAAMGHEGLSVDEYAAAWRAVYDDETEVHASGLHASFARLREHMQVDAKRAAKLDQRAGMLTQGYQRRAAELGEHLTQLHREGQEAAAELLAFQVLFKQESRAAAVRIENLSAEVGAHADRERTLQRRYALLAEERDRLQAAKSA